MAFGGANFYVVICFIYLFNIIPKSYGNDILGCGGFIKSHVNLDFSKVEVKLFTKQGSLKEKTECAPGNGYYFLPLYEHGDYVLKVDPPPGWSIEPAEIPITVDGSTDPCSKGQDVNFAFTGFGITGKVVTAGDTVGPAGVVIQLIGEKGEMRETTTKIGGDFHFTPVIPGKYSVKASHNKWKLEPSSTSVQVSGGNTEMKVGSLAVRGYDVRGKVTSEGRPIDGVVVLLYSDKEEIITQKIEGCDTSLLQNVKGNPICHITSDSNGEFAFGLIPAGRYYFSPVEKPTGQNKISFNIQPLKYNFHVQHDSLNVGKIFEVTGFTVEGRVLTHAGGAGMSGVQVSLSGNQVAVTGSDGKYTLTNLRSNTYMLKFATERCEFDDASMTVSASGVNGAAVEVKPSRWRTCGTVQGAAGSDRATRSVLVQPSTPPAAAAKRATTDSNGKWCLFLAPGVYLASVEVSDEDRRDGLQFFPVSQKINVAYSPLDGIIFSQLKATLSGRVNCMKDGQVASCLNVAVTLRPLSLDGSYIGQPTKTNAQDGKYSFTEVLPGSYEVSVPSETLCWSSAKHNIAVTTTEAAVPEFVHTGYAVSFTMSHKSEVLYTSGPNKGTLDVAAGLTQHCLPSAGDYMFTPKGCHIYEPATVTHSTRQANNMVTINAISHAIGISILANEVVDDLKLKIGRDATEEVGPLKPLPQKQDGMFVYRHNMMLSQGASILITPESGKLLFSPPGTRVLSAASGDCVDVGLSLTATLGRVLSGQVVPPIKDVVVTLKGGEQESVLNTGADGKYHFGPLDASLTYSLQAEKESYVLTGPDDKGNFKAQKLAEIIVTIVDATNKDPLQSALVSVSGGSSYRRNLATGNDGRLVFPSLAPGEYYLKPLMKEYRFKPPHRIITVKEGETHEVTLSGVRVACSAVGSVVTLGGSGVSGGATVLAEPAPGADPSKCPLEEAAPEKETGAFRVRGLLRGCSYRLRLKASSDLGIAHVIPPYIQLDVKSEAEDLEGLKFVAVQPLLVNDVSAYVYTAKVEHYKTLKLRLATELEPTSNVYTNKLDASGYPPGINPGLKLTLPRLPADNKTYFLQLESSLSKATHSYNIEPIYFNADGKYKNFDIEFKPKVKVSEQDLNQPSILILPLIGIILIVILHKEYALSLAQILFDKISARIAQSKQNSAKNVPAVMDDSQIDQIVQNINAVKKRPRKV